MFFGPVCAISNEICSVCCGSEGDIRIKCFSICSRFAFCPFEQTETVAPSVISSVATLPNPAITFKPQAEIVVCFSLRSVPVGYSFGCCFSKNKVKPSRTQSTDLRFIQILSSNFGGIAGTADAVTDSKPLDLQNEHLVAVDITSDQFSVKSRHLFLFAQERVQLLGVHRRNGDGEFRKGIFDLVDDFRNSLHTDIGVIGNENVVTA